MPIPDGLMFMVPTKIGPTLLSPLFSRGAKLRMMREWFDPPRKVEADESVASFVERHYGPEMVERLADPLLSGVYGGEASELSVRAVLPRFAEMEATHGSLGRAMSAAREKVAAANVPARPLFTSLKNGMQGMVDTVVSRLPATAIHINTVVQRVQAQREGWVVSAGLASDEFDAVVHCHTSTNHDERISWSSAAQMSPTNCAEFLIRLPLLSVLAIAEVCESRCHRDLVF